MSKQEQFTNLVRKHGYNSINNFCIENKIIQTNVSKRIRNDVNIDILILFGWANILNEPIDVLLDIFYPEQMKENRAFAKKGNKK